MRTDCERLRGHRILLRILFRLQFRIEKLCPDVLTFFSRFYGFSVSCNPLLKAKNCGICDIHALDFFQL